MTERAPRSLQVDPPESRVLFPALERGEGFAEEDADQKLLRVGHRLAPSLGVRHLVLPGIEAHGEPPAS